MSDSFAASWWDSAGSAPTRVQNSSSADSVRQYATTSSIVGTAARVHCTWVSAWKPHPMIPSRRAPGRARYFAATALAAPVRSCPRRFASMTAMQAPDAPSNSETMKAARYVLLPAMPSPRSTAAMSASARSFSGRRSRGWFTTSPVARRRKESSTIGTASAGSNSDSTSASVR